MAQYGDVHAIRRGRLLGIVALLCAVATAIEARGTARSAAPPPITRPIAPPPAAACPSAVHGLGSIAYVARGQLDVVDLSSCTVRRVGGKAWSPQFSPDGRWLAYSRSAPDRSGTPVVIPAAGGPPRTPLGRAVNTWWWAPGGATLYGVNRRGQLVRAQPGGAGGRVRILAGGARTFSDAVGASPDGRRVATDSSGCIPPGFALDTVAVRSGAAHVALNEPKSLSTFAGWSPDGRWLLYWARSICSASLSADGWPLDAVPARGGSPVQAVRHLLLFPDFVTWCGGRLIAASTPSRETQQGSRLVATGPPAWHQRTIARATHLSWVSPVCAPSGSMLAAAAGPSSTTHPGFGLQHRSIWLLTPAGTRLRRLTTPPATNLSDEAPRFSRDGRWLLFVRTRIVTVGTTNFSRDTVELVPANRTGPAATIPIASFTSDDFSFYDHFQWPSEIAWSAAAG